MDRNSDWITFVSIMVRLAYQSNSISTFSWNQLYGLVRYEIHAQQIKSLEASCLILNPSAVESQLYLVSYQYSKLSHKHSPWWSSLSLNHPITLSAARYFLPFVISIKNISIFDGEYSMESQMQYITVTLKIPTLGVCV